MPFSRFNEHISQYYHKRQFTDSDESSTDDSLHEPKKLKLSEESVDFGNRRIANIATAVEATDGVNLDFLEERLKKHRPVGMKLSTDAKNQRIRNVKEAEEKTDAVTLQQMEDEITKLKLELTAEPLDARNNRIINVADAESDTDAVPFAQFGIGLDRFREFLTKRALMIDSIEIDKDMPFNAARRRIMQISDPTNSSDAVNLRFMQSYVQQEIKKQLTKLRNN